LGLQIDLTETYKRFCSQVGNPPRGIMSGESEREDRGGEHKSQRYLRSTGELPLGLRFGKTLG
jgi:hypothetical protein